MIGARTAAIQTVSGALRSTRFRNHDRPLPPPHRHDDRRKERPESAEQDERCHDSRPPGLEVDGDEPPGYPRQDEREEDEHNEAMASNECADWSHSQFIKGCSHVNDSDEASTNPVTVEPCPDHAEDDECDDPREYRVWDVDRDEFRGEQHALGSDDSEVDR